MSGGTVGLFLVPASRENLAATIERAVDPSEFLAHLSPEVVGALGRSAGVEGLRCWAMTRTLQKAFVAMEPGDDVLLSEKGTGRFTHYGQITGKVESATLGAALWGFVGDKPWELVYFLRNIQRVDVSKEWLAVSLGYSPADKFAGSRRVPDDRLDAFVAKHGPIADALGVEVDVTDLDVGALETEAEVDHTGHEVLAPTLRRLQHQRFAQHVKRNYRFRCAVCGIDECAFLVASHIAPWSADRENRLNPANGLCLCVLHDRAFDRGYISLDEELRVVVTHRLDPKSTTYGALAPVIGRRIELPEAYAPSPTLLARHRSEVLIK